MIPLHEPTITKAEMDMVVDALSSNWVSTGGPCVDQFETEFAKFVDRKYAISTSNGTVGLQLMIEVLKRVENFGTGEPFDVIVPTLSFIATGNAVVHAGGRPVFVDCGENSLNMGIEQLKYLFHKAYRRQATKNQWIAKDTGHSLLAIMPAHIMGWGGDILSIANFCQDVDIPLIEDAAESFGSYCRNTNSHLGNMGLSSTFSFNGNKIITTGGGGMIVTDDESFARRAKHLSTTAKTDAYRYEHDEVGFNYRLVNILAAMGLAQLKRFTVIKERKAQIAKQYSERFAAINQLKLYQEDSFDTNHWLNNLIFENSSAMEAAFAACVKNKIGARPLWTPFHLQKAFATIDQPSRDFPNAEWMWKRCLSLPSSPSLSDDQTDFIVSTIIDSLRKA